MARKSDWIIGGALIASVFFVLFIAGIAVLGGLTKNDGDFFYVRGKRIGIIEVTGVINDAQDVVDQLIRYREDGSIPVIVLRIDSPGGVVAPTQEIFDEIHKTRKAGKKVIVSMGSVAASGGYYIACAADSILANPGTLTGSIGVIMQMPNVRGLFEKLGIDWAVVKSGEYKDTGSFARRLTGEERQYMQTVVDDVYGQFVDAVVEGRSLTRDEVLKIADGRVFTGNQAKSLGLVDRIGTYQDAIGLAADIAGITGKPRTVKKRRNPLFDLILNSLNTVSGEYSSVFLEYRLR